jgi:YVTN family beta-propeller protein
MSTQHRRVLQFTKVLLTGLCLNGVLAGLAAAADVAYVTNENGGVTVVDIATSKIVKEFDVGGKTPRGIGITKDGRYVLTANKNSGDMSVIDAQTGKVVRRVPLGPGPEFLRVYGDKALVTYEPDGMKEDDDDDEDGDKDEKPIPAHIAVVDIASGRILLSFQSGVETEGIEFSPDGKLIVTTNEGDEAVSVHNAADGKVVRTIDTKPYGKRPRGLAALPGGKGYVVTFENSSSLAVLDADFNVIQKVATKMGPNGVAFDPTGKLMLVAAARAGLLQIFDATTYALVKEVPIGRRCWHFTYTPDGSKILVACGRTDDLQVIDAKTFTPTTSIAGFKLPWGVVTYPKAHGSLDIP